MKLVYSRRALADLNAIATYYTAGASPLIAVSIGRRLESVIDRICRAPESSPRVSQRSQVRAASVVRYPFRIFYQVRNDTIEILHIRHTSMRPLKTDQE
ncbi:MAG TPA: type II toxin-antitoxin system RelE/ParE family toxin [Bradyrhizobium sp.]|nr:type II toxin-antitoxin system RelE/ParE family toxin [Bradyrhizobium sp.]